MPVVAARYTAKAPRRSSWKVVGTPRPAGCRSCVLGYASGFEPRMNGSPLVGTAIKGTIRNSLRSAQLEPCDIGHVNAHGLSTIDNDRAEAQAIRQILGDVPVTVPKSYFGNLGAGTGAVELAVSVLALQQDLIPTTLNYDAPIRLAP